MVVTYSPGRMDISWIAVEFPAQAAAICIPVGGMSRGGRLDVVGVNSTKYEEFRSCTLSI